uniref:G_PROTEIN_RECEP_F1_2 domain-containing protein n=1 Tax=Panagrellus redivivus TaxID=6233 RepID=A0A7E4VTN8_PANRE
MLTEWHVPLDGSLPRWKLVGYGMEIALNTILSIFAILVITKIQQNGSYHLNFRICMANMYVALPLLAVTRCLAIVQIISGNTFLTVFVEAVVFKMFLIAVQAMWYLQIPSIIERICATVFYRSYYRWRCWGTVFMILVLWFWMTSVSFYNIPMDKKRGFIMLVAGTVFVIVVYLVLFKINICRYRSQPQTLKERYQTFENMNSMYPLFGTMFIEVLYDVASGIHMTFLHEIVVPEEAANQNLINIVYNLSRELLLIAYCIPFLIFSQKRRQQRFLNRVHVETNNTKELYFENLRNQWHS